MFFTMLDSFRMTATPSLGLFVLKQTNPSLEGDLQSPNGIIAKVIIVFY